MLMTHALRLFQHGDKLYKQQFVEANKLIFRYLLFLQRSQIPPAKKKICTMLLALQEGICNAFLGIATHGTQRGGRLTFSGIGKCFYQSGNQVHATDFLQNSVHSLIEISKRKAKIRTNCDDLSCRQHR
jgi:hypothetical protein